MKYLNLDIIYFTNKKLELYLLHKLNKYGLDECEIDKYDNLN